MKKHLLNMGSMKSILSEEAVITIDDLWKTMPNESATIGVHEDYLTKLRKFKREIDKLSKHINRQFTIGNTQLLKARMRDHVDNQLDIFDYGINTPKEEEE